MNQMIQNISPRDYVDALQSIATIARECPNPLDVIQNLLRPLGMSIIETEPQEELPRIETKEEKVEDDVIRFVEWYGVNNLTKRPGFQVYDAYVEFCQVNELAYRPRQYFTMEIEKHYDIVSREISCNGYKMRFYVKGKKMMNDVLIDLVCVRGAISLCDEALAQVSDPKDLTIEILQQYDSVLYLATKVLDHAIQSLESEKVFKS